jgi:prevent-host-death family protein
MARGRPTIADTALELIKSSGPQRLEELVPAVVAAGGTAARNPANAVASAIAHDPRFLEADGCWFSMVDLLNGVVFTRRPTGVERLFQVAVLLEEDDLIERVVRSARSVAGRPRISMSSVGTFFDMPWGDESDSMTDVSSFDADELQDPEVAWDFLMGNRWRSMLVIPDEGVASLQQDDLLGIAIRDGAVRFLAVTPSEIEGDDVTRAVEHLRGLIHASLRTEDEPVRERPVSVGALLETIVVKAPDVFRKPLPPIRDLLSAAGFELFGGRVARRGIMSSRQIAGDPVEVWPRSDPSAEDDLPADDHYNDHMTKQMTATDLKAHLLAVLEQVATGEVVEVTKRGRVIARVVPATASYGSRGALRGMATSNAPDAELYSTADTWNVE